MNTQTRTVYAAKSLLLTGLTTILVACGGGGSSSSDDDVLAGSESVVARGVITQLGSIYVGGVKYETPDGGSYSDDDSTSGIANYKVGQVVSIRGRRNDDGVTGVAEEVEYEAEIEGSASGGLINNVTILITPKTNTGEIPGFGGSLLDGTRYEVSGIWVDNNSIEATYIKEDDDGDFEDEIKGYVDAVNPGVSFEVRDVTYNYAGPAVVAVGDYVEVHFTPPCAGSPPNVTCNANEVEIEDDYFDNAEGLEVEIEGAVDLDTTGCPAAAEFKVDGVCIDSSSKPAQWMDGLTAFADLVQGSRVEAEGHMVAGTPRDYLRADKVKGRGNRVRVSSIATNVSSGAGTFQLVEGNIDVTTMDGVTEYEDLLTINNITAGDAADGIEVRGIRTGPNSMLAIRIKLEGLSGGGDRHEIRAEVDENGADTATDSLTVMGIVSQANAFTELEIGDMVVSTGDGGSTTPQAIDDFLTLVDDDSNASNGPRDVVEIGVDVGTGNGSGGSPYTADEWEVEEEDD